MDCQPTTPAIDYYAQTQSAGAIPNANYPPSSAPVPRAESVSTELYTLRNQFMSFVEQTTAEVNSLKARVAWLESRLG